MIFGHKLSLNYASFFQHTYHHQCYDEDVDGGSYPGIPSECRKEPRCLVNTGDFRVVLADSRGERISQDGFGSLDDKSLKWQGVHFRFHPHVFHRDLVHKSPHIPTSLYLRVIKLSTCKNMFQND